MTLDNFRTNYVRTFFSMNAFAFMDHGILWVIHKYFYIRREKKCICVKLRIIDMTSTSKTHTNFCLFQKK